MVEGELRLMTRVWRGRAGKVKSSSGWMISATSRPWQPFPLLDCTMCSSGTSNTVSRLLSSKGVCSTPCLPSCCQTDAADTGVVLHQRSANAFLRFYHRTSSSQKNCPRDTNRRSSPATPSVVHQMLSAAFLGLSVVNFVGGPNRPLRAGFEYYRAFSYNEQRFKEYSKQKLRIPVLALGGEAYGSAAPFCSLAQLAENVSGGVIPQRGHYIAEE